LIMFGDDFKNEKGCYCKPVNYKTPIRKISDKFSIDEYEVFRVVRKFSNTDTS
ncbi:1854_t:CDS:1, partial [Dentiscutata heterogama]